MGTAERSLDGAIGEGWSGTDPDGCHVNVILAHRGGTTAAALNHRDMPSNSANASSASARQRPAYSSVVFAISFIE